MGKKGGESLLRSLEASASEWGVELSPLDISRLLRYVELVARWRQKLRLSGPAELDELAQTLLVGSLCIIPFLPDRGTLVDIGSGSGTPGVIAAVVRPSLHVVLVDASRKKAGFLQVLSRELGLENVEIVNARVEDLGRDAARREQYDVATARAVAETRILVEYALPLLRLGGVAIFPKGRSGPGEVASAERALRTLGGEARLVASPTGREFVILVRKVAPTPSQYPRRPGVPSRHPL